MDKESLLKALEIAKQGLQHIRKGVPDPGSYATGILLKIAAILGQTKK